MKNLYLLLICTLLIPVCLFSQGENDNWVFGNNAGVSFSSGFPISFSGSAMQAWEGVATISDSLGVLLFYTDGRTVWNRNHQIMPNGHNLTATGDGVQGVVVLPYPNQPNKYLIFTTNSGIVQGGGPQFDFMAYSVVDMTQDNGFGDIIQLNTPLQDHNGNTTWQGKVEAITVVNNITHYWIIMPYRSNLLAYSVDVTGVTITPVVSTINWVYNDVSSIKISPDKDIIAITEGPSGGISKVSLYYFNTSTGQVVSSTPFAVILGSSYNNSFLYSSEFSTSGNNLWISTSGNPQPGKIFGFNMNNLTLPPVEFTTGTVTGTIQKGPNDEMYVAVNFSSYLARIQNSDDLGNASFLNQDVYLNGNVSRLGLPQLVTLLSLAPPPPCPTDLVLSSPEQNNNFTYETSNTITTNQNYVVDVNQDITLNAGNAIEMQPNTLLKAGSVVLAMIDGCGRSANNKKELAFETIEIYIDLDGDEKKQLKVYPNPVKDKLNIQTDEVVTNVKIYDFSGTLLFQSTPNTKSPIIDMINFKSGIYFVEITIGNTTEIVRVIK